MEPVRMNSNFYAKWAQRTIIDTTDEQLRKPTDGRAESWQNEAMTTRCIGLKKKNQTKRK